MSNRFAIRLNQIARFYGVGIINTIFGYSLFFSLIAVGFNIYLAQIFAHLAGMTFNYAMFRRHVFKEAAPAIGRYLVAYGANYALGLGLIILFSHFLESPYFVGIAAIVTSSAINFLVLKRFVFNHTSLQS